MKMELLKSKFECDFMWRLQWFLLAQQNQRPANPHKNRRFENISMKTSALGWFFAPTAPKRKLYQPDISGVSQLRISRYDIQLHFLKLIWPLKVMVSNRNLLFQGSIFKGYVSFREGKQNRGTSAFFRQSPLRSPPSQSQTPQSHLDGPFGSPVWNYTPED